MFLFIFFSVKHILVNRTIASYIQLSSICMSICWIKRRTEDKHLTRTEQNDLLTLFAAALNKISVTMFRSIQNYDQKTLFVRSYFLSLGLNSIEQPITS